MNTIKLTQHDSEIIVHAVASLATQNNIHTAEKVTVILSPLSGRIVFSRATDDICVDIGGDSSPLEIIEDLSDDYKNMYVLEDRLYFTKSNRGRLIDISEALRLWRGKHVESEGSYETMEELDQVVKNKHDLL